MKKVTITQLLLTDDVSKLASEMLESGEKFDSMVLLGHNENGNVRLRHNCRTNAELIGVLTIALTGVTDYKGGY